MRGLLVSLLVSFLAFAGFFVPATAVELSDLDNPKITEAFVDGVVLPLMKENNSPSGVVSIIKDGKLVFAKGYGHQNLEKDTPVDPAATLFRPGSISKLFTWVSVMQMVEQGKLDLDADVNTYLKTVQIKDTFPGQPVTMRHIMTHSAGFEDGGLGYLIINDIKKSVPLAVAMERYQPERINPPGAQTAYSNYATAIAGLIVANLSGVEFTDYIQQNIFDVLGMKNSSFKEPLPDALNENMAVGYAYGGEQYTEKPFEIIASFAPAGSMSGTATDMMIFAQAILDGGANDQGRILKKETVEQMLTRNFSHDDRMMGMALGFYETEQNGVRLLGHGGDTQFFHSDLKIDLKNNMATFASFSSTGGAAVRSAVVPTLYDSFVPLEQARLVPPADFADRAGKYAGSYNFWRSNFSTIEKALGLAGGLSVAPSGNGTLIIPGFGEAVEIDKNLFQQMNGDMKIAFQENTAGEITGFVIDGMPFMSLYKTPFYRGGGFNYSFLLLSIVVFVGIILRRFYQRAAFKSFTPADKKVLSASLWVASANLLTFIFGAIVLTIAGDSLGSEIPTMLKVWLVMPIIATVVGLYHLYSTVTVWKDGLLSNVWARVRYSIVAVCALFMCWFYYFWNILGFQFLG